MGGAKCTPMRTALLALWLGSWLVALPALAEEATGKVRAIYYETSRGVLVDASMLRRPSATRWIDVELIGEAAVERKHQLVPLAAGMPVSVGDLVALRLGEPKSTQLAQIVPGVALNRAVAVNPQGPRLAGGASTGASTVK
jgi:hypothetical protein